MAIKDKISISLDHSVAERIRREAGDGHVSEWLNEAALLRFQSQGLARVMHENGVTLNADLIAQIESEWPTPA
jgi:hypothetical protein